RISALRVTFGWTRFTAGWTSQPTTAPPMTKIGNKSHVRFIIAPPVGTTARSGRSRRTIGAGEPTSKNRAGPIGATRAGSTVPQRVREPGWRQEGDVTRVTLG